MKRRTLKVDHFDVKRLKQVVDEAVLAFQEAREAHAHLKVELCAVGEALMQAGRDLAHKGALPQARVCEIRGQELELLRLLALPGRYKLCKCGFRVPIGAVNTIIRFPGGEWLRGWNALKRCCGACSSLDEPGWVQKGRQPKTGKRKGPSGALVEGVMEEDPAT